MYLPTSAATVTFLGDGVGAGVGLGAGAGAGIGAGVGAGSAAATSPAAMVLRLEWSGRMYCGIHVITVCKY
jgi:hypothetical protein